LVDLRQFRSDTLAFVERHRAGGPRFRYSVESFRPTLYSSCYAALTRSLYNDLGGLMPDERAAWAAYLNAHQDDDGLYRDDVIFDQGWYAGDPLWCGRPHLTCHVLIALTALGAIAPKEFRLAAEFRELGRLEEWLESRDWGQRVGWTGNEIMNVGTLLQYARDFHGDEAAGSAVAFLLDWLDRHHLDPETGVWGSLDVSDPVQRSHVVQAAYHWWPLYLYDRRPVPYVERALDTVLATQNLEGGFGWGVHNPEDPLFGSACEDIDSIDPLVRLSRLTGYRQDEVRTALERAVPWLLSNRASDGGCVFIRDRRFEYGHPELAAGSGVGAMFPTWFRTLTLALLGQGLPEHPVGQFPWQFTDCPGYQFWRARRQG
jgi:hypothetical protein